MASGAFVIGIGIISVLTKDELLCNTYGLANSSSNARTDTSTCPTTCLQSVAPGCLLGQRLVRRHCLGITKDAHCNQSTVHCCRQPIASVGQCSEGHMAESRCKQQQCIVRHLGKHSNQTMEQRTYSQHRCPTWMFHQT